ncbi:MAG: Transcriptional regulator, LysR family [Burkholderiaceae bacterium]|jgi:DNA-binding transcriptional LysR family regulator|nr:MAG: Transcriptional regulator, LysR family [Burkholderiaceae bacterium]
MQNLDDLALFATVVEHGGFAAAERATDIPKSKLSRRLTALETELGVRLIQRSTRRFAITPMGEQVLQHARAMLAEAEAARALVREQTREPRGTVRLACPPALLHAAVGPQLTAFLNAWPQVRLQVEATNRNVDVWQDGVDLALRVRAPGAPLPQDEVVRALALSPHLLVAAPRLLVNAAPPAAPSELSRLPTLGLGNSPETGRWHLRHADGTEVEHAHQPRLVVDDADALLQAALAGVGCALLPPLLAHDALKQGALQELLPGWTAPPGVIQLAYASRRGLRAAVRQLIDTLADGFARLIEEGRCLAAPDAPRA